MDDEIYYPMLSILGHNVSQMKQATLLITSELTSFGEQ